jgi:WD40 repeat protein
VWDVVTGQALRELTGHTDWVNAVAWSPDGTQLATASHDHTVRLWDPTTGTPIRQLTGHTSTVYAVAWSPDGTQLATASRDHTVRLWNPTTGEAIRELTGHTDWVNAVAWSPDGTQLAVGTDHSITAIWTIGSPRDTSAVELLPLADGGGAAFSDGWHKISGSVNGEFWYAAKLCRFEPGVLTPEQIGSRPLPPDTPLPMPDDS